MGFIDTKSSSYSKGRDAVASNKSDMNLEQHGGEGGGKDANVPGGSGGVGFTPGATPNPKYTGPGRNLTVESF